jgi:hypothetical protein
MSSDAERFVETLPVKGTDRELLRLIAKQIPAGETTTGLLATDDLAAPMGCHKHTVRRRRDALARRRVINVLDGGQGRAWARYELVGLNGTGPIVATPLPLIGAAPRPRVRPAAPGDDTTGDLFADEPPASGDQTAINFVHFGRSYISYFVHFVRSCAVVLRTFCTKLVFRTKGQRSTSYILDEVPAAAAHPLGVPIETRARDVHTFKNVHTPPLRDGPDEKEKQPDEPRRAPVHPWHAWCGPVCVPKQLHENWLQKGHTEAWLVAFYAETCAALTPEDARRAVDEFKFWRTALKAELARASSPRRPDILLDRPCPHQPPCAEGDTDACVDRSMADWRRDQARKSG